MSTHMIQRLIAPNDHNGNPRRLVASLHPSGTMRVFDEGYKGARGVILENDLDGPILPEVNITANEYKRLVRVHG